MTLILLDTTQPDLSIGLYEFEGLKTVRTFSEPSMRLHSTMLIPQLKQLCEDYQKSMSDLTGLAINTGPGSFTGIRTGLTTARVMGQFLPLKLYGFNTFQCLAALPRFLGEPLAIVLNGHRQQYIAAIIQVNVKGKITWTMEPAIFKATEPFKPKAKTCLIEAGLQESITVDTQEIVALEGLENCTLDGMCQLLDTNAKAFSTTWDHLQPEYVQQPHITQSNKVASS